MEKNHNDGITHHILKIPSIHIEYLGKLRKWLNLKIALEESVIWVKDFTERQFQSNEVQSLPYKELYILKNEMLFKVGKRLPEQPFPTLKWTSIQGYLQVYLPAYTHAFFNHEESFPVYLTPSSRYQPAYALRVPLIKLQEHIISTSEIRLKFLNWTIIDDDALILHPPLLPINGESLWLNGSMLIPSGYDLEIPDLASVIEKIINPDLENLVLWNYSGNYSLIPKNSLEPLSLDSVRRSTSLPYA